MTADRMALRAYRDLAAHGLKGEPRFAFLDRVYRALINRQASALIPKRFSRRRILWGRTLGNDGCY
mgnify:FL=1